MAKEPLNNIRAVCDEHAPKPQERFAKMALESFIGRHVKLGFPTNLVEPRPQTEHMWVKVKEEKNGELIGTLDNKPMFCEEYHLGDLVAFETKEIEEVFEEKAPASKSTEH